MQFGNSFDFFLLFCAYGQKALTKFRIVASNTRKDRPRAYWSDLPSVSNDQKTHSSNHLVADSICNNI